MRTMSLRIPLGLALAAGLAACGGGGGAYSGYGADSPNAFTAQEACHSSVKHQLLSPASAHFHGDVRTFKGLGGTAQAPSFRVTGQVDADNAYGAPLTERWTCAATSTDKGQTWEALASLKKARG